MNYILSNVINKTPKIALFIVILFVLGYQKSSYFGFSTKKTDLTGIIENNQLSKLYGEKAYAKTDDDIYYQVISENNDEKIGAFISSAKFASNYKGYAGKTPVLVMLDKNEVITNIILLPNDESRGYINRLYESGFFDQWIGHHIYDNNYNVDVVSGATMSSRSVVNNVETAINEVVDTYTAKNDNQFSDYVGAFAIIGIIALSLISYIFPVQTKPYRIILLIGSIAILGFWQGAFISIQLLYNWAINGTSWIYFSMIALVLLAILIPLLMNKSFYCQYVCPFGAAQELIGKIIGKKQRIPQIIVKIFRYLRQIGLIGIVLLLLVNPNFEPGTIEPFSAFIFKSATLSVIIIAGISLVTSLFINRPWCRLLCPTGEILSLLRRKINYPKKAAKSN